MQLLAATLLLATALAAPAPAPVNKAYLPAEPLPRVAPNTSTCALRYLTMAGLYTVNIGRPYANGDGCKFVRKSIRKKTQILSSNPGFVCEDNGHGQTMLIWNTNLKSTKVNDGLKLAYAMVDFTCDPYNP
ncbi:hypothetical protein CLAFUW4_11584 [Fulvia fulva]|uniref:Uncharacterized protein n=1 Tax=Passalora fulva TaxID=5499 RepID=A0A9Q8PC48_PASFU|nr:uncharacterized protein CLAFUR5_10626 [Fulvia fulva]KAK4619577.1 hypothetical protein CLAFUR4_11589 [Fulvia fulva]KAK4620399.1 hypothetical protein CLAFUR0_11598 [Fulvia fulva]UJO19682.1 hypothetical protein CLAFUR5_10626 [Fulvia fulva]WPV17131.1 hypothetical protein CLAFUW4_11584 [Fulvia fulva]WPV32528.1 hypothetical protein CLAFUW7_11588 [Fulvia fulva]